MGLLPPIASPFELPPHGPRWPDHERSEAEYVRSLRSMLISGWVVLVLLATAGFAAYSTRGSAAPPPEAAAATSAPAPALPPVSARVGAFILAESLGSAAPVALLPDPAPLNVLPGPDGRGATVLTTPEPTTTTTTADTTTSTAAQATTTSSAPPTTEAAARSAEPTTTTTTTTAAPTTTSAPATTTTAPASTTTIPSEGTTTTVAETATTTTPPASVGSGVERWRGLVSAYFPADLVDQALRVIECESRGDPTARNPYSGASGLFQFMSRTWSWASEGAGFGGADVYDPEANVASAAWLVDYSLATGHSGGAWGHWNCKP